MREYIRDFEPPPQRPVEQHGVNFVSLINDSGKDTKQEPKGWNQDSFDKVLKDLDSDSQETRDAASKKLESGDSTTLGFITNALRNIREKNEALAPVGAGAGDLEVIHRLARAGNKFFNSNQDHPDSRRYLDEISKNPTFFNRLLAERGIDPRSHTENMNRATEMIDSDDPKKILKAAQNLELYAATLKGKGEGPSGGGPSDRTEALIAASDAYNRISKSDRGKVTNEDYRSKSRNLFEQAMEQNPRDLPLLNYKFLNSMHNYLTDGKVDQKNLSATLSKVQEVSRDALSSRAMDFNHPSLAFLNLLSQGAKQQTGSSKLQIDAAFKNVFRDTEAKVDKVADREDRLFLLGQLQVRARVAGATDDYQRVTNKILELKKGRE